MKYGYRIASLLVGSLLALGCSSSPAGTTNSGTTPVQDSGPDSTADSGDTDIDASADAQVEASDDSSPDSRVTDSSASDAETWDGASHAQWDDNVLGRYALLTVVATATDAMGMKYTSTTYSFGTAEIRLEAGDLFMVESFCHIDLISVGTEIVVTIPDYSTRAIPEQKIELGVRQGSLGPEYRRPMVPIPFGARLTDIHNEPLPTSADDPRVWDEDKDGKPGGTSLFSGMGISGEIYAVRRERYTYDFTQSAERKLSGLMVDTSEQVIIGAEPSVLTIQVSSTPDPDPTKTYMKAVPLTEAFSCDRIVREKDALFPNK
jgi:hypothetical protein